VATRQILLVPVQCP